MRKPLYVTDRKFTGDTGCALDYQIGFEDECGGYCNFLGIGNKKEKERRADVLNEVRGRYPSPKNCADAEAGLPKLRADLADAQRQLDADPKSSVKPRYIEAYTTVLGEFTTYYNNNCLTTAADVPATSTPVMPGSINTDPILQTATPSGSTATSLGNNATTAGATAGASATSSPATSGTTPAGSTAPAIKQNVLSKVPKWAWWVAGGLVVVTIVAVVIKHKNVKPVKA
jgi:hypothetical protein